MFWLCPTTHVSPPFGAVSVTAPRIFRLPGELWVTAASLFRVIFTFTVAEIASGTVQAKLPEAAGVEAVIRFG
jgi:hypothetical protein